MGGRSPYPCRGGSLRMEREPVRASNQRQKGDTFVRTSDRAVARTGSGPIACTPFSSSLRSICGGGSRQDCTDTAHNSHGGVHPATSSTLLVASKHTALPSPCTKPPILAFHAVGCPCLQLLRLLTKTPRVPSATPQPVSTHIWQGFKDTSNAEQDQHCAMLLQSAPLELGIQRGLCHKAC